MNILSRDKQIAIISALTEGLSVRATARIADIDRKTVARLALRIGRYSAELHDRTFVGIQTGRLELDEYGHVLARSRGIASGPLAICWMQRSRLNLSRLSLQPPD